MSTSTMTAVPAAGWYEDPLTPSAVRWWNGRDWTEHTQAPPSPVGDFATSWATFFDGPSAAPVAAPAVPAAPVAAHAMPAVPAAPVAAPALPAVPAVVSPPAVAAAVAAASLSGERSPSRDEYSPVSGRRARADRTADAPAESSWLRPTHWNTPAVWAIAFTPWIGTVIALTISVLAAVGAQWYVMLAAVLLMPLLWIAFAVRDRRRLAEIGYHKRASWAWVLLGPLVYLIARVVRVRRASGHGWAPLWVLLANIVIVAGAALGVSMVLHADLIPQQLHSLEATIANDFAGQVALPRR